MRCIRPDTDHRKNTRDVQRSRPEPVAAGHRLWSYSRHKHASHVQLRRRKTNLILRSVSNHTLAVCEANVRRGSAVTHVVGNNLNTVVLPYSHTAARALIWSVRQMQRLVDSSKHQKNSYLYVVPRSMPMAGACLAILSVYTSLRCDKNLARLQALQSKASGKARVD